MWWLLLLSVEGTEDYRASTVYASETLCLAAQLTEEDRCVPVAVTLTGKHTEPFPCEEN